MRKLTILLLFLVSMAQAQTNIVKVEYWIDNDPGFDNATPVTGFASQSDVQFNFIIPTNLAIGIHTFGIRSKDANNKWSHTNFYPVNIADSSHGEIVKLEYFWDIDPGFGNGIDSILGVPATDITNGLFIDSVPLSFLNGSTHILFERSMDSRGRWSHTNYVNSLTVNGTVDITEIEELSGISVFPNPFTELLTVLPVAGVLGRLFLYDGAGRKVMDVLVNKEIILNTQSLAKGNYTVFILTGDRKMYRNTIIKQ